MLLWKHLISVATSTSTADICVGDYVTRIAHSLNIPDRTVRNAATNARILMHKRHLADSHFMYLEPLTWRVKPKTCLDTIPLPCPNLPALTANADSYLLVGCVPEYPIEQPDHPPPRVRPREPQPSSSRVPTAGTSSSAEPFTPSFQEQVLARLDSNQNDMNTLRSEVQTLHTSVRAIDGRLEKLTDDFERCAYPWYEFAYRSHMVDPHAPTPNFYHQDERFYRVDLSHGFDRLRIRGDRFENSSSPAPTYPFNYDDFSHLLSGDDVEMMGPDVGQGGAQDTGSGDFGHEGSGHDGESGHHDGLRGPGFGQS